MILNKFWDKTIKAAKQSIQQIYRDDLTQLTANLHSESESFPREPKQQQRSSKRQTDGVIFEASAVASEREENRQANSKLGSLRKYAARQIASNVDGLNSWDTPSRTLSSETADSNWKSSSYKQVYSRKDIQINRYKNKDQITQVNNEHDKQSTVELSKRRRRLSDYTLNQLPEKISAVPGEQATIKGRESELIKRLDRLESLIHLSLSSPNLSYASHPVFYKLLQKGVPKRLVTKWFNTIREQGINPDKQEELFSSKLQLLIQGLLSKVEAGSLGRFLFFTGRSGTGKTNLIMKLSQHPDFLTNKKIAIASVIPQKTEYKDYYTILTPFCKDNGIAYYQIGGETELAQSRSEWSSFDHILVDTPSLETEGGSTIENVLSIKNELKNQSALETHYIINTAINGIAFNDPLATEIEADHIALTHLDKSNKWGGIIQLVTQTSYSLRFISDGESVPDSLYPFESESFVQRLLR